MTTILLYALVIFIWGSTWLAVRYQVGVVPPAASVAYRIILAAICVFAWTVIRRLPLKFSLKDHLMMALQGGLIFSTNFFLFYNAANYLTTGVISVIFSTASIMALIINSVVKRSWPAGGVGLGCLLGFLGIALIFRMELMDLSTRSGTLIGLALSLGGTLSFTLGNFVSARNRKSGLSVYGNISWAMFYGAILLTIYLYGGGHRFTFDPRLPYIASLLYLGIIGSVVAFVAYFALLGRIETAQAAYATVLFPIISLTLSTIFENYVWSISAIIGVLFILSGNYLVLKPPGKTTR